MKRIFRYLWNTITTICVVIMLVLALAIVIPKIIGVDMYVVLSGSMEPTYPTGSVIYVKETEARDIEINDVITFHLNSDTVATHRVVDIISENEELLFQTKGDANDEVDGSLVDSDEIIGVVQFNVPYLGYIISYIQQPPGMYVGIALCVSVILMLILSDLLFEDDNEEKKGGKKT